MNGAVLILGATSAIGRAVARELAARGRSLILAGRDERELDAQARDLRVRYGTEATCRSFEATDLDGHPAFFEACLTDCDGVLGGVVACHGYAGSQVEAERDWRVAKAIFDINCLSVIRLLELAAPELERAGGGFICVIGSVAGDRGRRSHYLYGCAKAAIATYLAGLRHRLSRSGVSVTTVKPGYVDTPMTFGLKGVFLAASPARVGRDIRRAIERRRSVVYTPWFWRWIMLVVRMIPEPIFKRLNL